MKKFVTNDRGAILVFVAFALITLFVFGTFLLDISKTDFDVSYTQVARVQANYNAESRFNLAMAQLLANENKMMELKTIINDLPINGKASLDLSIPIIDEDGEITWPTPDKYAQFTVQKNDEDDITLSTEVSGSYSGKYGNATKNLKVQSQVDLGVKWSLFNNAAVITEGTASFKKDNDIDGEIYCKDFSQHDNSIPQNIRHEGSTENALPDLNSNNFIGWSEPPQKFISSGNLADLSPGKYYCTQQIDFYGVYSGHIVLVFENNVSFDKNNVIKAAGDFDENSLTFICLGNIYMKKVNVFDGIIFAPSGFVDIKKEGIFTGSILCQNYFSSDKGIKITYNGDLANQFNDIINTTINEGDLSFDIVYWK